MKQTKIFEGSNDEVEQQMNRFLAENRGIKHFKVVGTTTRQFSKPYQGSYGSVYVTCHNIIVIVKYKVPEQKTRQQ